MTIRKPLDPRPWPQDPRARTIAADIPDGDYVFVQDIDEEILVLPDGAHMHPKVLGQAKPALYAGEVSIADGQVEEVTNLSGTFQFSSRRGLADVARKLTERGLVVRPDAVRYFPKDGGRPEVIPQPAWCSRT